MSPNLTAFLGLIAYSEIGPALLAVSDRGYNVIVGSTPSKPSLFHDYSDHPRQLVTFTRWSHDITAPVTFKSTAAGRYQVLARYFDYYKKQLGLPDFGYDSQDAIAVQMIKECHALQDIEDGRIPLAVTKCKSRWASFPGSIYPGQHTNRIDDLVAAYTGAGGTLA